MCTCYITFVKHWVLILLCVTVQIVCTEDAGAIRDFTDSPNPSSSSSSSSELPTDPTGPTGSSTLTTTENHVSSTSTQSPLIGPWVNISTGKITALLLVSFSIPMAFMLFLFLRLQKEKKYMNRAGALVYRETVLVPSYTVSDNNIDANANNSANYSNVVQMHSALFDTPPDYEAIVNSSTCAGSLGIETVKNKDGKTEDIPPPAYSTVYM